MKHLTLAFVLALSVLMLTPALAQTDEIVETDVTIRVGGNQSSTNADAKGSAEFIEMMRRSLGDSVANKIEAEFDELSDEERAELEQKLVEENFSSFHIDTDNLGAGQVTIAVLAIVLVFGMPVMLVLIALYFSYRKRRQHMELIRTFVDAGKDVPEQLLDEQNGSNPLRSGITLVAVSTAVSIAFYTMGDTDVAALALIPLFLGIARLTYYYFDSKRTV